MILVTGATGGLGGLVVERLAGRDGVVAGTRSPERLPAGVPSRRIDFDEPDSLADGFADVETLLLVSAGYGEDDVVVRRHGAAIGAAEKAGVRHVVYTSLTAAGDHLAFALAHRWTERRLAESGMDWTILRNGLYAELLGALAAPDAENRITAPLGAGRLAAVAREDLADVAARVAVEAPAHAGRVYELVGAEAVGGADLAEAFTAATGRAVAYGPGSLAGAREAATALGAAAFQVPMLVSIFSAVAGGFLEGTGGDLADLLGRAPRRALDIAAAAAAPS